jgi:hypothetical protein
MAALAMRPLCAPALDYFWSMRLKQAADMIPA